MNSDLQLSERIQKLADKWRHSGIERLTFDALTRVGVGIGLNYLVFSSTSDSPPPSHNKACQELTGRFLTAVDLPRIRELGHGRLTDDTLRARMMRGHACFGVSRGLELLSSVWCAFDRCDFPGLEFSLGDDEVYFYDTMTARSKRGQGVLGLVQLFIFEELRARGITKTYGVSSHFNKPIINYRLKANGRFTKLLLTVKLFEKLCWHTVIAQVDESVFDASLDPRNSFELLFKALSGRRKLTANRPAYAHPVEKLSPNPSTVMHSWAKEVSTGIQANNLNDNRPES